MRHVAAYLLAALGESEPTAETIKDILGSVGVEAEDKQLSLVIEKFAGKNIDELIAAGAALLSSMPAGGVAAGGGGAPAAAAGGAAPAAAEEKKEEKKEEPQEESDDDMGFGLFD